MTPSVSVIIRKGDIEYSRLCSVMSSVQFRDYSVVLRYVLHSVPWITPSAMSRRF